MLCPRVQLNLMNLSSLHKVDIALDVEIFALGCLIIDTCWQHVQIGINIVSSAKAMTPFDFTSV